MKNLQKYKWQMFSLILLLSLFYFTYLLNYYHNRLNKPIISKLYISSSISDSDISLKEIAAGVVTFENPLNQPKSTLQYDSILYDLNTEKVYLFETMFIDNAVTHFTYTMNVDKYDSDLKYLYLSGNGYDKIIVDMKNFKTVEMLDTDGDRVNLRSHTNISY